MKAWECARSCDVFLSFDYLVCTSRIRALHKAQQSLQVPVPPLELSRGPGAASSLPWGAAVFDFVTPEGEGTPGAGLTSTCIWYEMVCRCFH